MPMILTRRQLVLSALGASTIRQVSGQYNPGDTKLAHRLTAKSVTDDDLLFLQQIGLRMGPFRVWRRPEVSVRRN